MLLAPAAIYARVFELAARRLQEKRRFAARRTKEPSMLQGLVVCKKCGYAYYRCYTETSKKLYYYYRCGGSDNYRWANGRVCDNRPVRQDYLDALVWEQVTQLIANPVLIRQELGRRLREMRSSSPVKAQKARLELELTRTNKARDRLVQAYQEELLSLEELRSRLPDLRKRETGIRAELEALEAQLLDQETCLKLVESLERFLARLRDAAANSSVEERQRVVRLLVKEVLVGSENVVIRHSIPSTGPDAGPACLLRGRSQFKDPCQFRRSRSGARRGGRWRCHRDAKRRRIRRLRPPTEMQPARSRPSGRTVGSEEL